VRGGFSNSPGYARARGVFGIFFIVLGGLIVFQIVHGVGLRLEAIPGILLGVAMMLLGYVRIRNAMSIGKPPA
jgi:hypothetical protein